MKNDEVEPVYVVIGWKNNYLDVLGVFVDENKAYEFEKTKFEEYDTINIIETSLDIDRL